MSKQEATELATAAVTAVAKVVIKVDWAVKVADATYLVVNTDGSYSVCDNGEETVVWTAEDAVEAMVKSLM